MSTFANTRDIPTRKLSRNDSLNKAAPCRNIYPKPSPFGIISWGNCQAKLKPCCQYSLPVIISKIDINSLKTKFFRSWIFVLKEVENQGSFSFIHLSTLFKLSFYLYQSTPWNIKAKSKTRPNANPKPNSWSLHCFCLDIARWFLFHWDLWLWNNPKRNPFFHCFQTPG